MIWLERSIQLADCSGTLIGTYDRSQVPQIQILLQVDGRDDIRVYKHQPSSLGYEDPQSHEVLDRYHSQVARIVGKLLDKKFENVKQC